MLCKWTLLLLSCVLLTDGKIIFPWTESDIRMFVKQNLDEFKIKLHQKLEQMSTNHSLLRKRQGSKVGLYLTNCLEVLESHLGDTQRKIDEISSKVKKVWFSSKNVKISLLKVNGKVYSRGRSNISKGKIDIKAKASSPVYLKKMINKIEDRVNLLRNDLAKTLSKSGNQLIESKSVDLKNVTVVKGVINELNNHVIINGLPSSRFKSVLRRKGNQSIRSGTYITNLSCVKSTVGLLNEKKPEDFLLLNSGNFSLSGSYVFDNLSTKTIIVNGDINKLDIDNIILTSKVQDIHDPKEFTRLSSVNIGTSRLGEIDTRALKTAKDDSMNPSALNISSNLIIEGSFSASSLNSYEIKRLFSNTVKNNERQNITGVKNFKSVTVKGTVTLVGQINNCNLDRYMTVNTNQSISSSTDFPSSVTFENIRTDSINGIKLAHHVVIKTNNTAIRVRGRKTFAKTFNVSSISLKGGILIDSFDPSLEVSQIVKNTGTVWSSLPFDSVTIGNINVTDLEVDLNYFPQMKNLHNVWSRTTEQNISDIRIKNVRIKELKASSVNNIYVEDLVTVKGNNKIQVPLNFSEAIYTKTLKLGIKSNVSFSPSYWNNVKVKIANNITIEDVVLKRNLVVTGSIKNFDSGFVQINDDQKINGLVQFENIGVKNLNLTYLNLGIINNINVTDFLKHAVLAPIGNKSIHNKIFKALNGTEMTWGEVLNKVPFGKIALKNSPQNISSVWTFMEAPTFKQIYVKSFFNDIKFEDVIYMDEDGVINNKLFLGNVTSTHLHANGLLNGINISSLQQKAFSKSVGNSLEKKITFNGNVIADKIQVIGSKIDSINLEDAIRLDAQIEFTSLNISKITTENITVSGLINGCNLHSVVENAFTLKESKNITSQTVAKSMIIEGDVKINSLTGEKILDWISFLNETSSRIIERNLEFESLSVNSSNFSQTLNNVPVNFVLEDAVKKKEDQNITGMKEFRKIKAARAFIHNLGVSEINELIPDEMFDSFVNKTENRKYTLLNPSIKQLIAKEVNLERTLNNLKLPFDVVLANENEEIKTEVVMNNSVNASKIIIYKINGQDLKKFLSKRITLNADQNISSIFEFNEDTIVQGNMELNGTINNIRFKDVFRNLSNQTMTGSKEFRNDLEVLAHVSVNGPINSAHLEQFLWRSKNETLKEVQFSMLNATDVICDTINGINISYLYNYTHDVVHDVNENLDHLTGHILSLIDSIRFQKDALEHPLSLFNYFELHDIIKFAPVLKFLPVYEYGTIGEKYELEVTQMVMWLDKKVSGCKKIISVIADFSLDGTFNTTKKTWGKVYPFSLQIEKEEGLIGFYVQVEDSRKCSSAVKSLLVKAIFSSGHANNSKIPMPEGIILVDIQLLELYDVYLMVAFNTNDLGERILLYHYDTANNSWSEHQEFHMQNLTSLEFILVERDDVSLYDPPDVYLSVTGDEKNPGVVVYEWDFDVEEFYLKTNLSTTVSTHALWLYAHSNLYLLLAKEKIEVMRNHTKVALFNEPLEVYTLDLDEDELQLNHIVNIKGVCFIESFKLAGEIFILATSSHMEVVYVLQFRGYNGFEVIKEIPAEGVTEARVFTVDSNLYLALNSRTAPSRILKASIRGGRLIMV